HILPDFIANMIAAGEVVQRPESAVKELVENSIDSGADSIAVIVRGAGKELIHIVDNGSGMNRDDLELSVKRHATSKVSTAEDLERIMTFGFRGEALASIAAVSQLEIRTRRRGDDHGWKLISEPMKTPVIEPAVCDPGTQVFVKNLFYNVPARRKFLKSNLTEFRHISETMIKFGLSHPEKRFTFYDNENLIFDVAQSPIEERISQLLGEKSANSLMRVVYENELLRVEGFIGQPHLARQSKSGQYLFLGGRSITSRSLSHAIFSAFEHLLEKQQQPFFMLNIKIDPERVDVNVHPQKQEVKFDNERYVYNTIRKAVSITLREHDLTPEIFSAESDSRQPFEHSSDDMMVINKATGEIVEPSIHHPAPSGGGGYRQTPGGSFSSFQRKFDTDKRDIRAELSAFDAIFGKKSENPEQKETLEFASDKENENAPLLKYWQLHNKYIIMQTDEGMMIVDQHAAHERILYEKAVKMMKREFASAQELLFPLDIKFGADKIAMLTESREDLHGLGFHFEIDGQSIKLRAVPGDIRSGQEENTLAEILELFEQYEKERSTDRRDNLAASYSCKAAIKTGEKLSQEEMGGLVKDLRKCEMPYVCPHGRPVFMEYTIRQLDKQFKRIL
ncbi:MAG: DNA mismatch repair endonuclease MutL, partial [Bacteroidota bacterium]